MASRLEQVDNRASSGSTGRQPGRNVGIVSVLKSNARNSASSSTRRGRDATAIHWNIRWANSRFASLMSCNVRSYVPSKLSGNSSKACRMRWGRVRRRNSSWQNTQRNLYQRHELASWDIVPCRSHIPSALFVSTSTTSSLSSGLHLFIFSSV